MMYFIYAVPILGHADSAFVIYIYYKVDEKNLSQEQTKHS